MLARIAEALRPVPEADATEPVLRFDRYQFDIAGYALTDEAGRAIPLTRGEFSLLREFVRRPGRVLSRDQLLNSLAGRDAESYDRSIDMTMVRLRRKIEVDPKRPSLIVTIPGLGYKFTAKVTKAVVAEPVSAEIKPEAVTPAPNVPASPERRQLTIVRAVLSGPAFATARRDPEDLQRLLAALRGHCQAAIAEAGGTIDRLLNDGVLIYFGYPRADEHQAERAVRTALKLIGTAGRIDTGQLGRLQIRVGVATGLAVVGSQISGEPAALGEAAHLAAGLASRAEPDAVLIAASTRRLVGGLFECRALEPIALGDVAEAVEAWQVTGEGAAEGRFEALRGMVLTPLVGREEELALLLRRWEQAKSGSGKVALISGEAGIGKSRLTHAVQDATAGQPHIELRFFCSPHHQDSALHPITAQLEHAAGFARDDTDETKLAKLEGLLTQSDATDEALALIADLLSITTDQRERILRMTPQARREKTLTALLAHFTNLATRQPVLAIYEDLHWIDPSSRELLDRSIEQLERLPVLLLATFRPEFQPPWIGQPNVTSLALNRLDRNDTAAMITELAREDGLPADVIQEVTDRTDGVPLFIEEVTKAVLESGPLAAEALSSIPHPALSVPPTLYASLIARLDRLGPAVREIAQKGAAIGREFRYELIACISDWPELELREALDRLTSAGLLFVRGAPPESTYLFKHALVQDTAYVTLLKTRRQELHREIAQAMEEQFTEVSETQPELLAHHYTEAKKLERAISLWQKAGSLALERMALAEAIAHIDRGMDLVTMLPPSEERDSLELDLRILHGAARIRGWPAQGVWDDLHRALDLANSLRRTNKLLPVLWGLYINMITRGRIAESIGWVEQILYSAERQSDPDLLIIGHVCGVCSHFCMGELRTAREHAGQVLALYTEGRHGHLIEILANDPKSFCLTWTALLTWMLGFPEQALKISSERDAHTRRRGHPFDLGWSLALGSLLFDQLGEPGETMNRIAESERLGRENRLPFLTDMLVPQFSGLALIRQGHLVEGIATLRKGLRFWEQAGGRSLVPFMKSVLAEAAAGLGELDRALSVIQEAIDQIERPGWEEREFYAEILRIKGGVFLLKGNPEGAERSYIASLDWARQQQAKSWELRTATSYARLMRDQGRVTKAYELLAPIYGWFTEGFGTKDLIEAKALLHELRGRGMAGSNSYTKSATAAR